MNARKGLIPAAMALGLMALMGLAATLREVGMEGRLAEARTMSTDEAELLTGAQGERFGTIAGGQIFHVDTDATGNGTGLSWTDAFTELQPALAFAQPGDQIWVAEGVYYPDYEPIQCAYTGWVTATFLLTDGVALYGGFDPGSGAQIPADRKPAVYLTVLSGDLDRDDTIDASGVVTDAANIEGTNAWTVVTASGVDETAVLDGLTITAGSANGAEVQCNNWERCRSGGGMYNVESSPSLVGVAFIGNSAARGGGMANYLYSNPTLVNVTFRGNSAGSGGGMMNWFGTSPTLIGVTFSGNAVLYGGGGLANSDSSPVLVNVVFSGNSSEWAGGGMGNYWECSPTLVNVTFSRNSARFGGGIHNEDGSTPSLTNCVLWGNDAEEGAQVFNWGSADIPVISYSLVQDGCPSGALCDANLLTSDPLFVDAAAGNLRLRSGSPAIDAGDNSAVPAGITADLAGNPRFVDVESVPDTGSGTPPIVDMGAYEMFPRIAYVDREATGTNSGDSWADAFTELQSALAPTLTVPGEDAQIWVAEAVYYPDYDPDLDAHTGWVTATFSLADGVALYGGFDPGSGVVTFEQRDSAAYLTVLSGDLGQNDTTDAHGVVTSTEHISGANAWTVVTAGAVERTAILDGFTITAGDASGADCGPYGPCRNGGGMVSSGSQALDRVTFMGNRAVGWGGALYSGAGDLSLTSVTFAGNSASSGGGVFNNDPSALILDRCTVGPGNTVSLAGGGIDNRGAMRVTRSTIVGNSGTGIEGGAGIVSSGVLTLTNCTVSGNETNVSGGGILAAAGSVSLVHCTVTGNKADLDANGTGGGGGIYGQGGSIEVWNTLIAGNGLGDGSPAVGPDLWGAFTSLGYNLIGNADGSAGFANGENGDQVGSGGAEIDPLLAGLALNPPGDTATHALLEGSPALDWIPYGMNGCGSRVTDDQRGVARPVPAAGACDVGAYEVTLDVYLPLVLRSAP